MIRSRRLSFQLAPLLDLMLIVFFLQYIQLREKETESVEAAEASVASQQEAVAELATLRDSDRRLSQELHTARDELMNAQAERDAARLSAREVATDLDRSQTRQRQLAEMLTQVFHVPPEEVERLLASGGAAPALDPQTLDEVRRQFQHLGSGTPGDVVKHLVTYAQVLKRCDIWDLRLHASPRELTLDDGSRTYRFSPRLESEGPAAALDVADFERRLFTLFKSLPQPKGLVIVLLTYDGAVRNNVVDPARGAIRNVLDRMRVDSDGRSQFEFADLGVPLE